MGYPFPRVFLRGLDPDTEYTVTSISGKLAANTPATATGNYWMSHGVDVMLKGDFQAAAFRFDAAGR
jgi:alpha-galactosidase